MAPNEEWGLVGKVAIVTGGAQGVGRAVALALGLVKRLATHFAEEEAAHVRTVASWLARFPESGPRPDDLDNPLVRGFGNEANDADLVAFAERFGCRLIDGYGQSETGASIVRVPNMPPGSLGMAAPSVVLKCWLTLCSSTASSRTIR